MVSQRTICKAPEKHVNVSGKTEVTEGSSQEAHSLTKLGEYLTSKSVNKAIVARKTGLSKQRMGELTLNTNAKLRAEEVFRIALAIGVRPSELFEHVCSGITLD